MTADTGATKAGDETAPPATAIGDLVQLAGAARALLGAHGRLLRAELGLARSALAWLLLAALAAVVFAVAFSLAMLGLLGVLLADWWHSWPLALAALAGVQLVLLAGAIAACRRCLHWLSLPASRQAWRTLLLQPPAAPKDPP